MSMNPFNSLFIRVHSRFICVHSRFDIFDANGHEYPRIFANRILRIRVNEIIF